MSSTKNATRKWSTVRSRLYAIGNEGPTFKTRMKMLYEYLDPVTQPRHRHKRELYFMLGATRCRMRVYMGAWKTSSKNEVVTMGYKTKKNSNSYWYVEIMECVTAQEKNWERVTKVRADPRGLKSELLWIQKGKTISGKTSSKLAHAIFKCLKPAQALLHDDAHITFGYAGGAKAIRDRARRKSHYKKKMAHKRKFRPKKGLRKKQRICIRVVRALCKGEAWYESLGFLPIKKSGHYYAADTAKASYSQHPAQYYAAIDRLRAMTINEIIEIFDEGTESGHSKLAQNARELIPAFGFKLGTVTLGKMCARALSLIRRNPKSLTAQKLFFKFHNTFCTDHENRFDGVTTDLERYYKDLNTLEITMLFGKRRQDFEAFE